ncbi:MAG: dihydropteroate synthase [Chitinophagaceae bacterium]
MFTLNCKGRLLMINKPLAMGVINVTPDSFYIDSRKPNADAALQQAEQLINEGAIILDVGGQSTHPRSKQIDAGTEAERILPVIEEIVNQFPEVFISVDTYYASVAKQAVEAGGCIVNDISAGNLDSTMLETVGKLNVPFICMHMQGTPQTMQLNPVYENVTKEILDFFIKKTEECKLAGINDIIIDAGFGFGKTITHNLELLHNLSIFKMLEKPMLIGVSRKSTIYKTLGITAKEALNGTTVLNTIALLNGANILRVHDVKEAVEAIKLVEIYKEKNLI